MAFLLYLHDLGRDTAAAWIAKNSQDVDELSTVDLRALFQGIGSEHHG
jgi:NTE family protein